MQMNKIKRYIGIVPRVKRTAKGEARPTLVAIMRDGVIVGEIKLETAQDELDFVYKRFPISWRKATPTDDLTKFRPYHIRYRKPADNEDVSVWPKKFTERTAKDEVIGVPDKVPTDYIGLKNGDVVAMCLGGSGDNFAFSLSRRGEKIGARVWRIPSFVLKAERDKGRYRQFEPGEEWAFELDKANDHKLLVLLAKRQADKFYPVIVRDRATIKVRETLRVRTDAMKARIACEQRLRQRVEGEIFCSDEGLYPEGGLEKEFAARKATDAILLNLSSEEDDALRKMTKAVEATEVYSKLLIKVVGLGPAIVARVISAIQDIRRFEKSSQLKKYMGAHVMPDGRFPRRRNNEVANWQPDARQALYLLAAQFNRRPGTEWGDYLRKMKTEYRLRHPEKIQVEVPDADNHGKTKKVWRYTDAHIHNMGTWRTISRFVEWLHAAWWRLEREAKVEVAPSATTPAK